MITLKKVLFVDDDKDYQKIISELLVLEGYDVTTHNNPVEALDDFKVNKYDLVITDLIMNTIDGLQLFSLLKKINPSIPTIILTGHVNDVKEIQGLDVDVTDYIYKPTSVEVLIKRVEKAISKNEVRKVELTSEKDNIVVNLEKRKVYKDNICIPVTSKEYDLLVFFLSNKDSIHSREEILYKVWRVTNDITDYRTIDTHIKNIRVKLGITSIISVRGVGYEWFE